jgi:protein-disulfide isomerase
MTARAIRPVVLAVMALLALESAPASSQDPSSSGAPAIIDIAGAPSRGPGHAPVTIVEFGDFQCPFCAQGAKALRRAMAISPDRARWVFKHYPLRAAHPGAVLAHEAALAAQEQGKFWEMHALLFENQARARYDDLIGYAEQIGLDMAAFRDALDTRRLNPQVKRDIEEGRRLRVVVTPTYFVNGVRLVGARTTPEFRVIIDAMARRPTGDPSSPGDAPPATRAAPVESPGPR